MEWNLVEELASIRKKIEALNIPISIYSSIQIEKPHVHIAELGKATDIERCYLIQDSDGNTAKILSWFRERAKPQDVKYIAAGIIGYNNLLRLASDLWLKEDVVPILLKSKSFPSATCSTCGVEECTMELAGEAESFFDKNNIPLIRFRHANEVIVSDLVAFEEYRKQADKNDIERLISLEHKFRGKKIRFFSATPRGGGVAIMRHALMRFFRLINVDAHWHVMQGREEVFEITKTKFHNVLQGAADSDIKLNQRDKEVYNSWIKENALLFENVFRDVDVIVVDDPQPAGLIPYIRKANPKVKIIFRSHIHPETELIEKANSAQSVTWQFLWNFIKDVDCFVSHPVKAFVPGSVPREKIVFMPATADLFDGLNKPLSERQKKYYRLLFSKMLLETGQTPLDSKRPYVIQIARFDPSKGIQDVVDVYIKVCKRLSKEGKTSPQLVLVGHASIDDPDGALINNLIIKMLTKNGYEEFMDDIKVLQTQHVDQLFNTLLCGSKVVLQLSHKEGFEIKVTEASMKGKPVIAYKAGGIPLQIQHGRTGFLVEPVGETASVANYLYELLTNDSLYRKMSLAAAEYCRKDLTTVSNAISWLSLANKLLE